MPSHNRHCNQNQERSTLITPFCHLQQVIVDNDTARWLCLDEVEFTGIHALAGADCTQLPCMDEVEFANKYD